MLKKAHEFIIRQFQVKNRKDILLLPLRLAVAYLIVRKMADDIRFFICAYQTGDYKPVVMYIIEFVPLFILIFVTWKILDNAGKKGRDNLINTVTVLILFNLFTLFLNRSLSFVYYIDGPYIGRVTDADTGEPIQGAVVMGAWEMIWFETPWTGFGESFAGVRETVSDRYGRFVLPFGSKVWLYPFSFIDKDGIAVFMPGYDSYPPSMQNAWSDGEAEEWRRKLEKAYPGHDAWEWSKKIKSGRADYVRSVYYGIFRQKGGYKIFSPMNIRLNKIRTFEERQAVRRSLIRKKCNCRAARFYKVAWEIKRQLHN
ncbi:hypothetical protein DENIS_0924 [Desulfonema ishimotonii]|uniref:Uncharacterized protein n=1 Tax=Desulfonema ishimotonii TaxID=45657 RepID=A0A401FSM9_9BACT|nr:carboxypeptidase-like regulatory domain-containing protein [Desulfonema ishimotonii]GBC59982.1 hypothetical protein DENIS_0924 [Desulfonema ishimotonii]